MPEISMTIEEISQGVCEDGSTKLVFPKEKMGEVMDLLLREGWKIGYSSPHLVTNGHYDFHVCEFYVTKSR